MFFETLLQEWRELLILWAQNGTLTRAAQEALQLEEEPEKLRELVGEWKQGDFINLPPVVLLPASTMPGAAGAYAISTGTIYLNQDWLVLANKDRVMGVLTEELGHHLDGLLNSVDTHGDEGDLFSARLMKIQITGNHLLVVLAEDDSRTLHSLGGIKIEQSALFGYPTSPSSFNPDDPERDFGSRSFKANAYHTGIDFVVPTGTPVYASASGSATQKNSGTTGYGKHVIVNHGNGYETYYAHLSGFAVNSGDQVGSGQLIGYSGSTGLSTGPHLHFEIRYNGKPVDPELYLNGWNPSQPPPQPPPSTDSRLALPIFDPAYYLATYTDVRNAYGASNHDGARSHWLQFGINEGRRGSLVFDPKDYLQRYQDVANAYGATNYAGAISHWLEWGLRYGRRGSQEFDPIYYMAAHPDVEAAYGVMNFSGAISHYYQWGKPGGWYGSEWITDQNAFQLWYYLNSNADVKAVTANANQEVEATRHWYFIGINEGRRGSAELDSKFYLANNPDVKAAYGDGNYRGAIDHYLLFGKAAGRVGANDTLRTLSISDASIEEGNNGTRVISFVVSLNIVSGEAIAVNFNTSNGTAASGGDYSATSGSLSFAPGETSKTVVVQINGDSTHEGDETFYVNLSGASYAAITRSQGVGTILNDDPANNAPTALGVSASGFNENIAAGSTVATLTTTDPDAGNTFAYRLVPGAGDADNNAFSITGNQLSIKATPDFETKSSYSLRIRSTDQGGLSVDSALTFAVNNLNEAPIALTVSTTAFSENIPAGSAIATLGTTDPDSGNTFSYSLVAGAGDTDNAAFSIAGNQLLIKASPDFESKNSFNLRIRSTDQGGLSVDHALSFAVNDLNEGPAITGVTDNVGLKRGMVVAGGRTDDRTPTINGTLSAVLASGETLRIFNGSILLGSATVNNTAKTWSYTPTLPASAGATYTITARIADAAGNLGTASAARRFVLDTTRPVVATFSPLDGAIGVDPAANIVLNFSEPIQRGTGTITLRSGSTTGPITESFDAATSSRLSIRSGRLTLNSTSNLAPNTRYFLAVSAGSITDLAGNPYAGTTTYDFRTINAVTGTAANDILSFTSTVDRLTGFAGADTFRHTSLSHSLLPAVASTPIDRITDLVTGLDTIDAPVARSLAQALNPVALGLVSELSASAITALLTPASFPALTTTSTGGVASFTFSDPVAGTRTFLAINKDTAGFSAATDAILEITGYNGSLSSLQVF